MRVQRTRSQAWHHREPLTRRPLGGLKGYLAVAALLIAAYAPAAPGNGRGFEYRCAGLEAYGMRGTYNVDAGGGSIRSKSDSFSMGFSVGPMVAQAIPANRRAGLSWMKVEHVGKATLRYGFDVKDKMLEGTIVGAPVSSIVNLAGAAQDKNRFLAVARAFATAPCQVTWDKP